MINSNNEIAARSLRLVSPLSLLNLATCALLWLAASTSSQIKTYRSSPLPNRLLQIRYSPLAIHTTFPFLSVYNMFQALIFQERDARGDLKAHRQVQSPPTTPPISPKMEVNIVKHPTRANLIGGKGLFVDMHHKQ